MPTPIKKTYSDLMVKLFKEDVHKMVIGPFVFLKFFQPKKIKNPDRIWFQFWKPKMVDNPNYISSETIEFDIKLGSK